MRYGDLTSFQTGVAVPLFSLHSKHSIGIGEFLDLIPFAQWAKFCGFNIIQLLPVNDTGSEPSPYSARSAFALNPVFINVQSVDGATVLEHEIEKAREQFAEIERVDYYRITTWKRAILRKIFDNQYDVLKSSKKLLAWIDKNSWVKSYCVYCTLKAQNNEASWKDWKKFQNPSAADVDKLWMKNYRDVLFQAWMQYTAEGQFTAAVNEVSKLGLRLKGDVPILINEDSADVWFDRKYFSLADRAGAPPDMFSYGGQNWGFPTYRWDVLEADDLLASSITPTALTTCSDSSASGRFLNLKQQASWAASSRPSRSRGMCSAMLDSTAKRLNICAVRTSLWTSCANSSATKRTGLSLCILKICRESSTALSLSRNTCRNAQFFRLTNRKKSRIPCSAFTGIAYLSRRVTKIRSTRTGTGTTSRCSLRSRRTNKTNCMI